MVRKEVGVYLSVGALVLLALAAAYVFNTSLTGFVVFEEGGLISPESNAEFATNEIDFVVNVSHPEYPVINVSSVSLSINGLVSETNESGLEGVYNFSLNLQDGDYNWSILVSDSNSTNYSSSTRTFVISIEEPEPERSATIYSPEEGKTYETNEAALEVSSNFNTSLWQYSLNDGENNTFEPNTTLESLNDGDYSLVVYANDTDGNVISTIVFFSVLVPACSNDLSLCEDEASCESENGYWYDDLCNSSPESEASEEDASSESDAENMTDPATPDSPETQEVQLETTPTSSMESGGIDGAKIAPGDLREFSWTVRNKGDSFLMQCGFSISGDNSEWISSEEGQRNINPSEEFVYSFIIDVPEDSEEGQYSFTASVSCQGDSVSESFNLNVETKKIDFNVIDARKSRQGDYARVIYSFEDLSGESQDVEVRFTLENSNGTEVANVSETHSIEANKLKEFSTDIPMLNDSLEEEMILKVNYNSEIYSSSVEERINLGTPIAGFAVFEGVGAGEAAVFVGLVVVLGLILVFVRRMRKKRKTLKDLLNDKPDKPKSKK